ncbi:NHL repeat-containing protein [Streptomyces sp. L500]
MPSTAGDEPTGPRYPLTGSAKPVSLTWNPHDQQLWFVTGDAQFGRFATETPHENKVFPSPDPGRSAEVLVAWKQAVWTYALASDRGCVVKCTLTRDGDGRYDNCGRGTAAACPAMTIGSDATGAERIVATLSGMSSLTFIDADGDIQTSDAFSLPDGPSSPLLGLAVAKRTSQEYWLSSPGSGCVVLFDARSGEFSKNPVRLDGTAAPGHLAITETAQERVLWVATDGAYLIKYDLDRKSQQTVRTDAVPDRLFAMPDGSLWFTMPSADAVDCVLPGATHTAGGIGTGKGSKPSGIATDTNSQLWVGLEGTAEMFHISKFRLTPKAGQGQEAEAGSSFKHPLRVRAGKLDGTPVGKATIKFVLKGDQARFAGGGTVDIKPVQEAGDDMGVAESAPLRAEKPGQVDASAEWLEEDVFTPFEGIVVKEAVGSPDHLGYRSGAGQHAATGEKFAAPLSVVVRDAHGAPVGEAKVFFRVMDDAASFENGSDTAEATSGADGVAATSQCLIAGSTAGRFRVQAWAAGAEAGVVFGEYITDH